MDGLVYNPEHARKNLQGVTSCSQGRRIFTLSTVFALEGSIEKIVLRWNDSPFAPVWDQIKRE